MLEVVRNLSFAAAVGFVNRLFHGVSFAVRVKVYLAGHVSRSSPDCLNERGGTAKESLLIGVEHGNK
ncbi:unannotated protein [freshwater metagenome]|uniref:Unannotated protein n=1 Tax=freshwater metagenome TaxID=449393 RepID=A0A6J7DYM2_9ZZZZ